MQESHPKLRGWGKNDTVRANQSDNCQILSSSEFEMCIGCLLVMTPCGGWMVPLYGTPSLPSVLALQGTKQSTQCILNISTCWMFPLEFIQPQPLLRAGAQATRNTSLCLPITVDPFMPVACCIWKIHMVSVLIVLWEWIDHSECAFCVCVCVCVCLCVCVCVCVSGRHCILGADWWCDCSMRKPKLRHVSQRILQNKYQKNVGIWSGPLWKLSQNALQNANEIGKFCSNRDCVKLFHISLFYSAGQVRNVRTQGAGAPAKTSWRQSQTLLEQFGGVWPLMLLAPRKSFQLTNNQGNACCCFIQILDIFFV